MGQRGTLIPYHFGTYWDLIPNRAGEWTVVEGGTIAERLKRVSLWVPRLVVSGDCMAAIPAHRQGMPLVWFDAHGDYHTLATTYTGSIGGMPLAMLRGRGDQTLLEECYVRPATGPCYHVGGSQFDRGERERMVAHGVYVTDRMTGPPATKFHLHVDTDVIRSEDLPSSIHPAPNGMPLDLFWRQMDLLLPHAGVLSIKCYDPRLDHAGRGESIVLELIRRFEDVNTDAK